MAIGVAKLEMHLFANITWSHDRWATWLDGWAQLNLRHTLLNLITKIYMYYKLGQAFVTNWGSFVLLQIRANVVKNWDSFLIPDWGNCYYKLGQNVLQVRAIITNWGIIPTTPNTLKHVDKGNRNGEILMDLSKTFYTINHGLLLIVL